MLTAFRDELFTTYFPHRREVPKTLIYAKNQDHAERVLRTAREVFGRGNEFACVITHKTPQAKQRLAESRNSPQMRIAVTVDKLRTGTDVKAIECLLSCGM